MKSRWFDRVVASVMHFRITAKGFNVKKVKVKNVQMPGIIEKRAAQHPQRMLMVIKGWPLNA
jgi:hypothetical protein